MPLYEYACEVCGEINEAFRSVEHRNRAPACRCGGKTNKIISYGRPIGDVEPYYDENLDTFITSREHRRKVMKEKDVYEYFGKGWH